MKTVYEELFELCFLNTPDEKKEKSEEEPSTWLEKLRGRFIACQVNQMIQHSEQKNLIGVKSQDVYLEDPSSSTSTSSRVQQTRLIPALEKRFLNRVDSIWKYYSQLITETDITSQPCKNEQEPEWKVLLHDCNSLRLNERIISEMTSQISFGLLDHFKILIESLDIVCTLLKDFKFEFQLSFDTSLCTSIEKRSKTMACKIEYLKQSLLRETYSPESVLALTKIR